MNRPDRRNALDIQTLEALLAVLRRVSDETECRAVVLRGAGPDFCAGADVEELSRPPCGESVAAYAQTLERLLDAIEAQPQPVIACIHGAALGAGCQIALACDLAVAAEDASFGIPAGRLGLVIGLPSIERLMLAVGPKRAAELLMSAATVSGRTACEWGLVNRSVDVGVLREETENLATAVAGLAPLSVKGSKRGLRSVLDALSQRPGHEMSAVLFDALAARAHASDDLEEGLTAFRDRRRPAFRGH